MAHQEFADFIASHMANLAETFARLLTESGNGYQAFPTDRRTAAGRKLLKATIESCKTKSATPLGQLFADHTANYSSPGAVTVVTQRRWPAGYVPPDPVQEIEALGQTLTPVVTNLEAGKFLWQILADVRASLLAERAESPESATVMAGFADAPEHTAADSRWRLLAQAVEQGGSTVVITNLQGIVEYVNPRFTEITGYTPAEVIGKHTRILKSGQMPPETYARLWAAISAGDTWRGELLNRTKNDELFWEVAVISPIKNDAGKITGYLAVKEDITQLKQAQLLLTRRSAELETVAQVGAAISTILDTPKLLQKVVDLTKEQFGLYHAHIYQLDENGEVLTLTAGAGQVGQKMVRQGWSIPLDREQSLVARAARQHHGVIVNNVQADPGYLQNPLLPNTRAEMAVPLMVANRVLGVLDVQADAINRFTDEDLRIHTALGAQVAVALQNASSYAAIQAALDEVKQSQGMLQTIINATPDWIFVKDRDHRYQLVNRGYAEALNMSPEVFIGKNDLELGFPEEIVKGNPKKGIRGFWPDDQQVLDSGQPLINPYDPAHLNDQMRILHTIKTPLRDAQNQIYAVLGFARDVTEREQLLAHAEALYQAGAGLNLAQTHHAILDVFLQYTLLGQNADNVSLNYFDTPLSAAQTPRWIYTLARYSRLDQGATGNRHAASELPALFDLLEKNDATIITDVSTDPRLDEVTRRYYTGRFGAHSTIFIPLVIGGQWYGFINAIYGRPATFPEPDVRRLMILAGHAAVAVQAIQQLQATERRARREQTIREITEKMRGATNLHSLIKVTATELAQNLSAGAAVVELGLEPAGSHPPAPSSRREGAN